MRIRKIIEYTDQKAEETFNLIIEEREEGWEMTREEMGKLADLIQESLNIFPMRRPTISIIDIAKKSPLEAYRMDEGALLEMKAEAERVSKETEDLAEECPDYIEPPEPEVICENGACRLVLDEELEAEEVKSDVTIRDTIVKAKKKSKRDYSKYIEMKADGADLKVIQREMMNDFGISNLTAENYYYTHVKNKPAPVEVIEKEKKELKKVPKEIEPKINKKKVDPVIFEAVDSLPDYYSVTEFKDACAAADIGRGKYSITALKEVYLDTHPAVRW